MVKETNTEVAEKKEETPSTSLTVAGFLNAEKTKKYLEAVLKERAGQFITSLVSLSNLTPGLARCEPRSLMMCGMKAASLNLPLDNNLGFAYAIPYKSSEKGIIEASFQLGYRAFIQLAMRTGLYRSINVIDIREGELKKWDALTENLELEIIDDEKARERSPIIGYAAIFELSNGFRKTIYRKKDTLLAHGKRFSRAFSKGPWQSDTDAMCRKTLIKELLSKWGPLSTEIMEGIKFDQSVIRETPTGEIHPEYVDNQDIAQIEPPSYDIDEKTLIELKDYYSILGISEAEQSMELASCKGNPEAVEALRLKLKDQVVHMPPKGEPPIEKSESPHGDELFGKAKIPEEKTVQVPFGEQDKEPDKTKGKKK